MVPVTTPVVTAIGSSENAPRVIQIAAIPPAAGGYGITIVALDDSGKLWTNVCDHLTTGGVNWRNWEPVPGLPAKQTTPTPATSDQTNT